MVARTRPPYPPEFRLEALPPADTSARMASSFGNPSYANFLIALILASTLSREDSRYQMR